MICPGCSGQFYNDNDQVDDRDALVALITALLADDRKLARIMACRIFTDGDLSAVDAAIFRAPACPKEKAHG